jgi:hypothetical protein
MQLDRAFQEHFAADRQVLRLHVAPAESALRAKLYRLGRVLEEHEDGSGGSDLVVELPLAEVRRLESTGVNLLPAAAADTAA